MTRSKSLWVSVIALTLGGAFVAAQGQDAAGGRGRGTRGLGRDSLLGLLGMEPVQKDLQLTEEQGEKVKKITEDLTAAMRKDFEGLQSIEDQAARREKMTELSAKYEQKACEQLGGALSKEQMDRLGQVRMQVRSTVESLGEKSVAEKLKLKKDQAEKIAQIAKDAQAKRTELFRSMRDATQEQRTEAYAKYRKAREDADKEALAVLTEAQQKAFEELKGKKIDLPTGGRGQR